MTTIHKTFYISADGKSFDTADECVEYEHGPLGLLTTEKCKLTARLVELERMMQFRKSKCHNGRCMKYAHSELSKARKEYADALKRPKTKYRDLVNLKDAISTLIHSWDNYRLAVNGFLKLREEYKYIRRRLEIASESDSIEQYHAKCVNDDEINKIMGVKKALMDCAGRSAQFRKIDTFSKLGKIK